MDKTKEYRVDYSEPRAFAELDQMKEFTDSELVEIGMDEAQIKRFREWQTGGKK